MTFEITPHNDDKSLSRPGSPLPPIIEQAGERAQRSFIDFFTADIENDHTRSAYAYAVGHFFRWCQVRELELHEIRPPHVAAYFKQHTGSKPTKKQHLAALRRLFDYLVIAHAMEFNPADAVRGPRYSVRKGKTPDISAEDMRRLFEAIDTTKIIGLRDRALIAVMFYTFGRVGAVAHMDVGDYYHNGRRSYVRLSEKGGKQLVIPVHHKAQEYLDEYLDYAGIKDEKATPLFRTVNRRRHLTKTRISVRSIRRMVKKRAVAAGLYEGISPHSLRASGITIYLENGGSLEHAQSIAGHADPRTTKLYDRTGDKVDLDEIEKIVI